MNRYSLSQYLALGVALLGGVAAALLLIRWGYTRAVIRVMRANAPTERRQADLLPSYHALVAQSLPTNASPSVARLLKAASGARARRRLAIVLAILFVGFLQGLVYLTLIESGPMPPLAVIAATFVYSTPSFILWAVARTLSHGQPTEVGLWAGLAMGLLSGAAVLISLHSFDQVRFVTLAAFLTLATLVAYVVLLCCAALLRGAQVAMRFSSESIAPTLSCLGASTFGMVPALQDGKRAGILFLAAALLFPVSLGMMTVMTGLRNGSPDGRDAPRLLLLRRFGHARRSRQLLRELARPWLELGPIDLFQGPDVASSVVTLDKVYAWLTGRLKSRFIGGPDDFDRVREHATRRFRDGRYPVVEFSCLESAWRETVTRLAGSADAILMDVRSFTRQNSGCAFEIQALTATVRPERVVFLVDSTTDNPALSALLGDAFATRVFRFDGDDPAHIGRAIWAALEALRERSVQTLSSAAPACAPESHTRRSSHA
jgi:hypothetical protein